MLALFAASMRRDTPQTAISDREFRHPYQEAV
jgi:hypothetical protein